MILSIEITIENFWPKEFLVKNFCPKILLAESRIYQNFTHDKFRPNFNTELLVIRIGILTPNFDHKFYSTFFRHPFRHIWIKCTTKLRHKRMFRLKKCFDPRKKNSIQKFFSTQKTIATYLFDFLLKKTRPPTRRVLHSHPLLKSLLGVKNPLV